MFMEKLMDTTLSNSFYTFDDFAEGISAKQTARPTAEELAARREAMRQEKTPNLSRSWKKNHSDSGL